MARLEGVIQALVIHDTRITAYTSETTPAKSYSEAGPRPGSAIAADPLSTAYVQVYNAQANDLDVRCIRGGDPRRGGAAWTYRVDGEAGTAYRGWNEPNLLRSMVDVRTGSAKEIGGAVTIPSTGQVVVVAAGGATPESMTWDPVTRTFASPVTIATGVRDVAGVALVPETETVIAWFDGSGSAYAMCSSDAGATWQDFERGWLSGGLDATVTSLRVVRDRYGNYLMVATNDANGDTWWYVSTDGGHTFEAHPTAPSEVTFARNPSLVLMQNGQIAMVNRPNGTADITVTLMDDAYDDPTDTDAQVVIAASTFLSQYSTQTAVVDADGAVYVYYNEVHTAVDSIEVARSIDHGLTWTTYDYSLLQNHHHLLRAACATGGEILLLTEDREVVEDHALICGGWENIETDNAAGNPKAPLKRFGMGYHATDVDQLFSPGYADWTLFGWTASGTAPSHGTSYVKFDTTAATGFYEFSKAHVAAPEGFEFQVYVEAGGNAVTREFSIDVARSDGVNDYRISIRASTTAFRVYDDVAGTTLTATINADMTTDMQFLLLWGDDDDKCTIFYKRPASSLWLVAVAATGLTASGAPLAQDRVRVGCTGITTTEAYGLYAAWWRGPRLYDIDNGTVDGSRELRFARPLSALPYPVRDQVDEDGKMMHLGVRGRAARYTETFDVAAEHDYSLQHLVPTVSPKPGRAWRSTQVATDESFEAVFGRDTRLDAGWNLAVGFVGAYVPRQIDVELLDSTGAVVGSGTYDGATGFDGLSWTEDGPGAARADVVRPKTGTANGSRYSWEDEWRGGYGVFDAAGTPKVRPILSNSAGYWTMATGYPRMEIRFGDMDGTEDSTTLLRLVHPGGVLIIPGSRGLVFERIRVTVDGGQPLPHGYFTVGAVPIGALLMPGHAMGRGWSRRHVPQTTSREDDEGTLWIQKRGAQRREFTWSYQDGNDQYPLRQGAGVDYVAVHSALPETVVGDVEAKLAAALARAKGGAVPALMLLSVPDSASASTVTDPTLWMYGRLTGVVQANNVLGQPGTGEHVRVESLTFVELAWDLD